MSVLEEIYLHLFVWLAKRLEQTKIKLELPLYVAPGGNSIVCWTSLESGREVVGGQIRIKSDRLTTSWTVYLNEEFHSNSTTTNSGRS